MSTFADRTKTALMVIDVQNDVVATAFKREETIANINTVIAKARAAGTEVIWVQHSDPWMPLGSELWEIVSELQPAPGDEIIHKTFRSSFEETNLEDVLAAKGISHLVISGAQTNFCVRNTLHAAYEKGYDVTLVGDAHTTSDTELGGIKVPAEHIIAEQNAAAMNYGLPGRKCDLVSTAELSFS